MANYNYKKIAEPEKWTWYNSENRAYLGDEFSNILDQHDGVGSYYQTFTFDGTDTDSEHRKTVTLFTLNNGVHVDLNYYVTEEVTPTTPPRYGRSEERRVGKEC